MFSIILIGLILTVQNWAIHPVHKPLQVVVGSEVVIDLIENPTTGYTWKFFDDSYAAGGFLSFVSDSRVETESAIDGAPSIHRFVFHGEKSGSTRVRFVKARFGVVDTDAEPESYFVRVVEKDDTGMIHPVHKPLEVLVGSEVMIDVAENPTTGYTWEVLDDSYATGGFLSFVSDSRVEIESAKGAPSVHRFVFHGEKSGSTRVRFVQKRFGVADVNAEVDSYFIHVVEKPDTGMIVPLTPDTGMIYVDRAMEVVVGREFVIDLPKISGYTWKLTDEALAIVTYVSDYVDRSRPEFQQFVFQAEKVGFTMVSFTPVPIGEVNPLIFFFPKTYKIHVVEQTDTGMIRPKLRESGIIHPVHKPLEVVVGSEIVIEMAENPTTGYTWEFFDDSYAAGGFLSFVRDSRVEGENAFGAPSVRQFVFHGEKSGSARVRFVQARFGVVDVNAEPESYFVHVVAKPDTGIIHPVHKPLEVVVGSEVVIDLIENPTTGYTWEFFDDSYTAGGFLSFVSDSRVEARSTVGAPSVHRFVFRGEKSGSTIVRFVQARFGVVDVSAEPESYFVHVVAKPDTGIIHPVHKPLEVVVGSEVVIDLIENPSTGSVWSLFDEGYAADGLLSYVRDETLKTDDDDGKIVGKSTIHRFVFRGEKSGYAKVSFFMARRGKDLPSEYFVHVVEKPDTGMIAPL